MSKTKGESPKKSSRLTKIKILVPVVTGGVGVQSFRRGVVYVVGKTISLKNAKKFIKAKLGEKYTEIKETKAIVPPETKDVIQSEEKIEPSEEKVEPVVLSAEKIEPPEAEKVVPPKTKPRFTRKEGT